MNCLLLIYLAEKEKMFSLKIIWEPLPYEVAPKRYTLFVNELPAPPSSFMCKSSCADSAAYTRYDKAGY